MPSISVVIPFYKDYAFVRQAVDSVLSEKLADVEVIVVNDNPCDRSQSFLDSCKFSSPVRIVTHERNRGLSAARNTGVENANGDYVCYLDADDFVLPGGLKRHLGWTHDCEADVCHAVTVLREQRNTAIARHKILPRDRRFFLHNVKQTTLKDFPSLQFLVSSWQSIYRREFLNRSGIRFDEAQKKFEDRLYVLETVFSDAQFALTDAPVRVWRRRSESITTSDKSVVDIEMMTALIDKCTGLAEARVADGTIEPVHLGREVTHSLGRLLGELPVLDAAIAGGELANRIRPVLSRAMSRVQPNVEVLEDPIAAQLINLKSRNGKGLQYNPERAIGVWTEIARGDWDAVGRLRDDAKRAGEGFGSAKSVSNPGPPPAPAISDSGSVFEDRELILHLGMHKTGTTYLQRQFELHYDDLREAGVLFPRTGFVDHHSVALKSEGTPGHHKFAQSIVRNEPDLFRMLEEEVAATQCKKVVISCENLCFPYMDPEERREMASRADRFFSAFPNRRVVAVIRRPDRYVESMYREKITAIHSGETRNILEFLNENRGNLLNFQEMLAPWMAVAGQNNLVLDYGKARQHGNYFAYFCQALGLAAEGVLLEKADNRKIYQSPHWDVVEIVRSLKLSINNPKRLSDVSRSFINAAEYYQNGRQDCQVLSVDDRLDIIADCRDYNERFFEEIGFEFDFDAIERDIEAQRAGWLAPTSVDYRLIESLMGIMQIHAVPDALGQQGQAGSAKAVGTGGTSVAGNGGGHLASVKRTLMPVYRNLPAPLRKMAKDTFARIAGQ